MVTCYQLNLCWNRLIWLVVKKIKIKKKKKIKKQSVCDCWCCVGCTAVKCYSLTNLFTCPTEWQSAEAQAIGGRTGVARDRHRDTIHLLKVAVTSSWFQAFIWSKISYIMLLWVKDPLLPHTLWQRLALNGSMDVKCTCERVVTMLLCFPRGLIYASYTVYVLLMWECNGGRPACLRVTLAIILCSAESI